jgi:hypothetical protein
MALGPTETRLSYLEQIIIIIIINGGWRPPIPHPGDSFASDMTRLEALSRVVGGRPPIGDTFAPDITRLSLQELEDRVNEVAAAVTRLQGHHGELNARLKEMRTKSVEGSQGPSKP